MTFRIEAGVRLRFVLYLLVGLTLNPLVTALDIANGQNHLLPGAYQPGSLAPLAKGDDSYSCKKGVLCETYACCGSFLGGDTGTCGFGEAFCGSDCDSQCDAKAECGQFADPPGMYYWILGTYHGPKGISAHTCI